MFALCLTLGRPALDGSSRLFTRFGGVKTAVIRLAEADATRLLQLGIIRIGWVAYRIREHAWLWPWVPGLQQPRQEEFLLEMRCRGSHGQELQGNAEVPDVSRQGR